MLAVCPASRGAGMASLGYQAILRAARDARVRVDRLFLTPFPAPPRGIDNGLLPAAADLVAVSASWESDLLALPVFLRAAGVPVRAEERTVADPVVVLGGPLALLNVRPVEACLDLVCTGDGDLALPALLSRFAELKTARASREECLAELAKIQNLSRPPLAGPLRSAVLPCAQPARSVATSPDYAFGDTFLVELSRGCPCRCPFCLIGALSPRARAFPLPAILAAVTEGEALVKRFGLVGAAALSHPELPGLLDELIRRGHAASFSSLYAERIDEPLCARLVALGQRTITFGLESGVANLRRAAGKPADETLWFEKGRMLLASGIARFKFYVIARMPGAPAPEEEAERLAAFLRGFLAACPKTREVSVSVNPFTPKPRTPWGREAAAGAEFPAFLARLKAAAPRMARIDALPLSEARRETCLDRIGPLPDGLLDPPDRPSPAEHRARLEAAVDARAEERCRALPADETPWPEIVFA